MMFSLLVLAATLAPSADVKTMELAAQSCVGEAGFNSATTGECAAIIHIYRKRSKLTGVPLYRIIRKYSAAIKPGKHSHKWVRSLKWGSDERPEGWPEGLSWKAHIIKWRTVVRSVRTMFTGGLPDPLPNALHYGGRMDRYRLDPRVWRQIKTPKNWGNYFYERVR